LAKVDYGVAGDFGITDIGARVLPSVFFFCSRLKMGK